MLAAVLAGLLCGCHLAFPYEPAQPDEGGAAARDGAPDTAAPDHGRELSQPPDKAKPEDKAKPVDKAKPADKAKPVDKTKPVDKAKPTDKTVSLSWKAVTSPTGNKDLRGIWGSSATNVYAVGSGSSVIRYDGKQWKKISSSVLGADDFSAAWGFPDPASQWLYVTSLQGKVFKFVPTAGWSKVYDNVKAMQAISGADKNTIWAVGKEGRAASCKTGCTAWSTSASMTSKDLNGILLLPGGEKFMVGDDATVVRHYKDGPWTWKTNPNAHKSDCDLNAVWGSGPSDVWAVGEKDCILRFQRSTNSWKPHSTTTSATAEWNGVWGSGPSDVYVVGQDTSMSIFAKIYYFNGVKWKPIFTNISTGQVPRAVWGDGKGKVFVVGDKGLILVN